MTRTFSDSPAVRSATPLLIGLVGPSGCGKTLSALRLAVGIQRVTKGKIYHIDTEANRALHYAPAAGEIPDAARHIYDFEHVPFVAPFGPADYLGAITHCREKGAGIIIVDSGSHEHEGPGGVLEMHDAEQERLVKQWNSTRDKVNLAAWQKPKSERRRLINAILQMPINFIFCFRAKEKVKPGKDKQLVQLGWQPIAGEEFVYEMTVNMLLHPASGGVPTWMPEEPAEKLMIKKPSQFEGIFKERKPLSEDIGEALARWASGETTPRISGTMPVNPETTSGGTKLANLETPAPLDRPGAFPNECSSDPKIARRQVAILKYREKIGPEAWIRVLGNHGATCLSEITTVAQAEAIGAQMKETLEAGIAREARAKA